MNQKVVGSIPIRSIARATCLRDVGGYGSDVDVPALPRRYVLPLACAGLSASVTLLLWVFTTPGIDAPSHLFQTWLFSHGGFDIYNNYWYAGRYEFVNYSMLYYAVAAQVGQLGVLLPASVVLGGCFALVCSREWASAARGPSSPSPSPRRSS